MNLDLKCKEDNLGKRADRFHLATASRTRHVEIILFLLNDALSFDPCFLPLLCFFSSWDDSSSVSSGISDTIDNLSTDDINTSSSISSYANTPASSRKNLDAQVRFLA